MSKLSDILNKVSYLEIIGDINTEIDNIEFDSRKVTNNSLFVATVGILVDGHNYIDNAIKNGAIVIICERLPEVLNRNVAFVIVNDTRKELARIASNYYGTPSEKITLIGITGTNGKTTIATLLYKLFNSLNFKSGLLSTVENYIGGERIDATHTTPDPVQLNSLLRQMIDEGCKYCFMEVSSHAIDQKRIEALDFNGGVFTNISHDHLDYHKTFKNYITAKKVFFDGLDASAFALVNSDDKNAGIMLQNTLAHKQSYAIKTLADYSCRILEHHFDGMLLQFDGVEVWTQFIGDFNASNLLAVYAVAVLLGAKKEVVLTEISKLTPVRGRFETIKNNRNITGIVDYAHTPDALKNVLQAINKIKKQGQVLITVVGAGGNRDKEKRPVMAKTACDLSDKLILTSDNPRDEDPQMILKDMESGLSKKESKSISIADRKQAIKTACLLAKVGDIVLIAGKGHETYQEIKGVKYPFDDKEILKEYLNQN